MRRGGERLWYDRAIYNNSSISGFRVHQLHSQYATTNLSRNRDLNLNTRLQADAGLLEKISKKHTIYKTTTNDLLNDLARGVQVNEAFVDFEFVTVPCFGSLTARLWRYINQWILQ